MLVKKVLKKKSAKCAFWYTHFDILTAYDGLMRITVKAINIKTTNLYNCGEKICACFKDLCKHLSLYPVGGFSPLAHHFPGMTCFDPRDRYIAKVPVRI